MPDPTIPELVARLRELHEKLQALQVGTPEFTAARQLFRDALQLSAPGILDALDHIGDANKMVRGIPARTQGMQRERSTVTNETTTDAVEAALCKMYRTIVCDYGALSDMTVTATLALEGFLAERARHAEEVAALRAQLRRLEGLIGSDAVRRINDLELQLCTVRDQLDDAHIELAARRALDADVRACAEYVVANSAPAAALSKEHQVFRETARRILAALDSQGGEGGDGG